MPKLVLNEEAGTREVVLRSGDTAGRVAENAIRLAVPEASRRHCKFIEEKGVWFVEDLGSSNGTLVNGRRVSRFELADGDVIQIGLAEMRFLDVQEEAGPADSADWGEDDLSLEDEVFLVLGGTARAGDLLKLPQGKTTVGRNAKHALRFQDASVSGDHAEVIREGNRVTVVDLDSKNGTFLNGRRVDRSELHSGDEVRFGNIPCTFGVGDPAAFAPPAPIDEDAEHDYTRAMDTGDFDDDQTFTLKRERKTSDVLFNLIALVMVVGLGALAFFLSQHKGRVIDGGTSSARADNLLPPFAWSFEMPEETEGEPNDDLVWEKLPGVTAAEIELVTDRVRTGTFALGVDGDRSADGPALVALQKPLTVSGGAAYQVTVEARGSSAIPVVGMAWFADGEAKEGATEEILVGTALVYGPPSEKAFETLSGIVVVPDGAMRGRFVVGLASAGRVVFDDAHLQTTTPPEGRSTAEAGTRAILSPQGALSLSRYGRAFIHGMGLAESKDGALVLHDELVVGGDFEDGRLRGTVRGGRGELRASLGSSPAILEYTLDGAAVEGLRLLAVPVAGAVGAASVTTLTGDRGQRHRVAFADLPADAVVLGLGPDRARLRLKGPEGASLPLKVSYREISSTASVVLVGLEGAAPFTFEWKLTFKEEEAQARALLVEAKEAERQKAFGKAMALLEQVRARFPFDESLEGEASALLSRLTDDGRRRLEVLTRRLDDAEFFRTLSTGEADLARMIKEETERYAGTELGEGFLALEARRVSVLEGTVAVAKRLHAERDLLRASDYMEAERYRLAKLFLESIVEGHPNTDEADLAEARLARLRQVMNPEKEK